MVDNEKTEVLWRFGLQCSVVHGLMCLWNASEFWIWVWTKHLALVQFEKLFQALLSECNLAYKEVWQSHLHLKVPSRWRSYFGRTALMEAMNCVQRFGAAQPMLSYVCVSLQFPRLCTSLFSPGPEAKLLKCEEESNSHGVSSSNRIRRERGNLMRKLLRLPAQAQSGPWSSSSISSEPLGPHFWVHGSPITPEWQRFWCPEASSNPMELYCAPAWRWWEMYLLLVPIMDEDDEGKFCKAEDFLLMIDES